MRRIWRRIDPEPLWMVLGALQPGGRMHRLMLTPLEAKADFTRWFRPVASGDMMKEFFSSS